MLARDYRDILGGVLLVLIGAYVIARTWLGLPIGTLTQMGPGMFPAIVGAFVVIMGLAIAIPALSRAGDPMHVDLRSAAFISVAIATFGLMIRPFGLVPAVVALTLLSTRASGQLSGIQTVMLCAVLCLIAVLIFKVGFAMQVPVAAWPW